MMQDKLIYQVSAHSNQTGEPRIMWHRSPVLPKTLRQIIYCDYKALPYIYLKDEHQEWFEQMNINYQLIPSESIISIVFENQNDLVAFLLSHG